MQKVLTQLEVNNYDKDGKNIQSDLKFKNLQNKNKEFMKSWRTNSIPTIEQ